MSLCDRGEPVDSALYIRGDSKTPGRIVPRRFLRRLSPGEPQSFQSGSGRLELARAIASPDNPLTARVIVNRVWQWHFGTGLVATPSDFGLNGQPPSHPKLLDWLTSRFISDGWSVKKLHRLIMNSSVYQQASHPRDDGMEFDAQNRLRWRFTPRRMNFEEMRDSWLTAAGTLKHQSSGRPADLATANCRSVYLFIDRYDPPDVFSTFDFATPDFSTAQRDATTVPQQALYMMNSQWLLERSRELATRNEVTATANSEGNVQALFEIVYQRLPDKTETAVAVEFLRRFPIDQQETARQWLAHALLQTSEAIYVP